MGVFKNLINRIFGLKCEKNCCDPYSLDLSNTLFVKKSSEKIEEENIFVDPTQNLVELDDIEKKMDLEVKNEETISLEEINTPIDVPEIDVPEIDVPEIDVSVPEIVPEITEKVDISEPIKSVKPSKTYKKTKTQNRENKITDTEIKKTYKKRKK